jgi:hypothetical protein
MSEVSYIGITACNEFGVRQGFDPAAELTPLVEFMVLTSMVHSFEDGIVQQNGPALIVAGRE